MASTRPVVNAMSVDVKDYFQVSAFDGVVSRSSWDGRESRVCANTERLLELFAEADHSFTRWGIDRLNRVEGRPAIFYVHPWELDPDQPRIVTSAISSLRHYRNLDTTEERLR